MAHNQAMVDKNKDSWGSNVRIIGVSIDKDAPTVKNHVNKNGWGGVEHYHRAKSQCSDIYKVNGVPHILIIDTNGKIAFKGHPAHRPDLEQDFNDLLAGKSLEGVEDPSKPAEMKGKRVDMDKLTEIMAEMDKFNQEIGPAI